MNLKGLSRNGCCVLQLSSMMEDLLSAHQKAKADNDQLKAKINQFNSLVEQVNINHSLQIKIGHKPF